MTNPRREEEYDDMYQDIANSVEIMHLMDNYQAGELSRRRCISDIIKILKDMGYRHPAKADGKCQHEVKSTDCICVKCGECLNTPPCPDPARCGVAKEQPPGLELPQHIHGCHSGYCVIIAPEGQQTNGPCTCDERMLRRYVSWLKQKGMVSAKQEKQPSLRPLEREALAVKMRTAIGDLYPDKGNENFLGGKYSIDCLKIRIVDRLLDILPGTPTITQREIAKALCWYEHDKTDRWDNASAEEKEHYLTKAKAIFDKLNGG
jgi:hypothetical protein